MTEKQVALAAVAGAHGISGEVRLKLFADSIESLSRHKLLWAGKRQLTLTSVKGGGGAPIARFGEIRDRDAAEALRGTVLSVPRSALPPLEEGEYYHADLIGLPCESKNGEPLGNVVAVENFGAGDIIEVEASGGKRFMVPFRSGMADLVDARIVVDPLFLA
ncbi:ribosome maturation factor RimM [Sphingosinicella rhizophila]|uniref:Ribosome maturation factor RimM n=1 Tax=Sphingosinicella rhizophila TaxID=3050082 RepID=A0ABU3Q3C7_9SPHN|nr:ribosome maturation factor RimM [Sphingosinicella sp. GR2756]MDT9597574.1 ribosome maturation factor RimM [Sphingosinicella sp. GR2756]